MSVTKADANKLIDDNKPPATPTLRGLNKSVKILPTMHKKNWKPVEKEPIQAEKWNEI